MPANASPESHRKQLPNPDPISAELFALPQATYQQSGLPAVNFFAGLTAALNSRSALEPINSG